MPQSEKTDPLCYGLRLPPRPESLKLFKKVKVYAKKNPKIK